MRIRDRILRRSAVRSTLLLLTLVVALVAGLLAMHTLTSGMESEHASQHEHASGSMVMTDPTPDLMVTSIAGCAGACDPNHMMASMVCVLALLVVALAYAAARASHGTASLARASDLVSRFVAASVRVAPPPDLFVLSISRT